ncbi:tyrosine-type recombinase/integrase [Klebsiella aerogenes]|uniref:tyrosine-type recombinase/integrase n=1 Tax=Klebsiella aerogenes TaxID=548 RepID=UPI00186703DA|nr:tyrosine-type recombinase/integrase [Klebsiella aerogenes]
MSTQVIHTSYTSKAGYVWRQRYSSNTLSIALQTKEPQQALLRSAKMSIRYEQIKEMGFPFDALRMSLKKYRDDLVKEDKLNALQALISGAAVQEPTQTEKVAVVALQREFEEAGEAGHTLEEAMKAYFESGTEWSVKTIKDYTACLNRFNVWCAANNINTIEAVTKDNIIQFKSYMDEAELAPNTKQKVLTRLGGLFKFTVDVKEWRDKNPITGMMYKKVGNVTEKEEVTPAQYETVMSVPTVANDEQVKWANAIMYHTGVRVSELCQLTKADYIEIEGIKCISINTHEEGKSTKTETSKRNIPLCDKLLAMGIWEKKPVMKTGVNSVMDKVSKSFKLISLKRSTHCFRHSLSNRLRDTGAEDSTRAFILGHAQSTMTDRVYVTREPLKRMLAALNAAN